MQLKSQVIWLVFLLALVYMLACQGCHTIEGIGADIQDGARSGRVWLVEYAQE